MNLLQPADTRMLARAGACVVALLCVSGCALHNVRYNEFVKARIEPVPSANALLGSVDEAKALLDQAKLPHNGMRDRYNMERRAGQTLLAQLGSQDYVLLGEMYGGGNAYSNLETLKAAFCERAAAKGGDVVLVFRQDVQQRQFVYTTPGYSTTNVQGSAYRTGNYAYGSATANSTYTPGQTYVGTMGFPIANGLVFKYVPGVEARRARMDALPDAQLESAVKELEGLWTDDKRTLADVLKRWDEILEQATAP
ncbi:MAG: hypothetical protein L6Q92_04690 [Phycisphaerae bacterium]|nr:hypothetical protein [Phycisphaerae bacterium]